MDSWPVGIAVFLVYLLIAGLGTKLIERFVGRRPIPENRIYYAGTVAVIPGSLLLLFFYSLPDSSFFVFIVAMLSAFTLGEFVAQCLFGRRSI